MTDANKTEDIRSRVHAVIVKGLTITDHDTVQDNKAFIEDLGADSLDLIELVMAFEEEFGIEIPDSEAETIKTVGDAVAKVEAAIAAKAEAK